MSKAKFQNICIENQLKTLALNKESISQAGKKIHDLKLHECYHCTNRTRKQMFSDKSKCKYFSIAQFRYK